MRSLVCWDCSNLETIPERTMFQSHRHLPLDEVRGLNSKGPAVPLGKPWQWKIPAEARLYRHSWDCGTAVRSERFVVCPIRTLDLTHHTGTHPSPSMHYQGNPSLGCHTPESLAKLGTMDGRCKAVSRVWNYGNAPSERSDLTPSEY
jgi:hypothetical protein